jgi:hypothetical protein
VKVVHIALHILLIEEKAAHPVRVDIVPAIIIMRMRKGVHIPHVPVTIITAKVVVSVLATTAVMAPLSRVVAIVAIMAAKVAIVERITAKAVSVPVTTAIARTVVSTTIVRSASVLPITIPMLSIA